MRLDKSLSVSPETTKFVIFMSVFTYSQEREFLRSASPLHGGVAQLKQTKNHLFVFFLHDITIMLFNAVVYMSKII